MIIWGVSDAGIDQRWYGDTVGAMMVWDQSQDRLEFTNTHILMGDDDQIQFGEVSDITMSWNPAGYLHVQQVASDSMIVWGVDNAGIDQRWYGDTSGAMMQWDQSSDTLKFISAGLMINGTAGADFNGAVTNLTVVKGIVTAAS